MRALAGAGRANNGDLLAAPHLERDVIQHQAFPAAPDRRNSRPQMRSLPWRLGQLPGTRRRADDRLDMRATRTAVRPRPEVAAISVPT